MATSGAYHDKRVFRATNFDDPNSRTVLRSSKHECASYAGFWSFSHHVCQTTIQTHHRDTAVSIAFAGWQRTVAVTIPLSARTQTLHRQAQSGVNCGGRSDTAGLCHRRGLRGRRYLSEMLWRLRRLQMRRSRIKVVSRMPANRTG